MVVIVMEPGMLLMMGVGVKQQVGDVVGSHE